jgi:aerobic-type carbon monoxide dehydrogenase small subunit (CoxS/CutS family)
MDLTFTLNGQPVQLAEIPDDMTLLVVLREVVGLTGTKQGCESGVCGACSVLVDDRLTRACRTPAAKVAGRTVTTIEGLRGADGSLSDLQAAFLEFGAVQCGYCTPAMVMAGEALLRRTPQPTRAEIRRGIAGVLCRCTGYQQIVDAIAATARRRLEGAPRAAHSGAGATV